MNAIERAAARAAELTDRPNQPWAALTELLNGTQGPSVTREQIWNWRRRRVPAHFARRIEKVTGVPAEELCPEVFR